VHGKKATSLNYPLPSRLLIIGCGDVGLRLIRQLRKLHPPQRLQILASARRSEQAQAIRDAGAIALKLDLDRPERLRQLAGLARWIVLAAPPSERHSSRDMRTRALIAKLQGKLNSPVSKLIYISTTGVFGDWGGNWIDETVKPRPILPRSLRRLDAERCLKESLGAVRLRVPGIYAEDRLPIARIQQGQPCLEGEEDSYSNHIHADDLASIVWLSLFRAPPARLYAVVDDEPMKMGEWFDRIAVRAGLAKVPRASREAVKAAVSPMMWSFMQESRRISNRRLHREIRPRLKAPSAGSFIDQALTRQDGA